MDLAGIEKRRVRRKLDRVLFGGYDLQRDKDEETLIAEVKRLREQLELEHDQGESFLTQIKELQAENERLKKHSPERKEKMNDNDRKRLTEWLGEEWTDPGNPKHSNRTFTEPDDMMACKDRLVELGRWEGFIEYCLGQDGDDFHKDITVNPWFDIIKWLLNPERFCQLVSGFLKEGNDEPGRD